MNSNIQHYHQCIDENNGNPKTMRRGINQLIGRGFKTTHITSSNMGNEEITDESKITVALKTYFISVPDMILQTSFLKQIFNMKLI